MSLIQDRLESTLQQQGTLIWDDYVNMLKMLKSLFKSERHWLLEFLQNAEDAGARRFSVIVDDAGLTVMNDGKPFSKVDFESLCSIKSRKSPAQGDLGYLGLGFKSIFRIADRVDVHSSDFHFKFDRSHWESDQELQDWPWEVLPIELDSPSVESGFATSFQVPQTDPRLNPPLGDLSEYLTGPDFPVEIILLLNHVEELVFRIDKQSYSVSRNKFSEYTIDAGGPSPLVAQEIALVRIHEETGERLASNFLVVRKRVSVPEHVATDRTTEEEARRSGVSERDVGIVFSIEPQNIPITRSGNLSGVYSFLPLEGEQTGLPFGISGDFVPDPGRDLVKYDLLWNQWLCDEIASLFQDALGGLFLAEASWQLFPATLMNLMSQHRPRSGTPGSRFWDEGILQPIRNILSKGKFFNDIRGEAHLLEELIFLTPEIRGALGHAGIQLLDGVERSKHIADEEMEKTLGPAPSGSARNYTEAYDILNDTSVLESLKDDPNVLANLYCLLAKLNPRDMRYRLGGREGRAEFRFDEMPFVLADDNQFHCPKDVLVLPESAVELSGFLKKFVEVQQDSGTFVIHSEVATDAEAVSQLQRCGVRVLEGPSLVSQVYEQVFRIHSAEDCVNTGWTYPDDLIDATLYVLSQGQPLRDLRLMSAERQLRDPNRLFLPEAALDWSQLYSKDLLPTYYPVNPSYTDLGKLALLGISEEKVFESMREAGVHGFDATGDRSLVEDAAYAIAERSLRKEGHRLVPVQHRENVGYDIQCSGHCDAVYEVKGMTEQSEVQLEPSEVEEANIRRGDYYLICVYNLPKRFEIKKVRDPKTVWEPVERARVPASNWLAAP